MSIPFPLRNLLIWLTFNLVLLKRIVVCQDFETSVKMYRIAALRRRILWAGPCLAAWWAWIMLSHPQDVHILTPRACRYFLCGQRDFANVFKVRLWMWGDSPRLSIKLFCCCCSFLCLFVCFWLYIFYFYFFFSITVYYRILSIVPCAIL